MSRAFVKEPDGDQAEGDILEKPQSEHPNYMTLQGLEEMKLLLDHLRQQKNELKAQEDDLVAKNQINTVEADLRYLEKRLQCAIPVDVAAQSGKEIRFGATVELVDENDSQYVFTIVGEDEVDVDKGRISWVSPLAKELIGKEVGDILIWERPAGNLKLKILDFSY